jgi:hypothetical protein
VGGAFTGLGGGTGTTVRRFIGAIPLASNTPTAWDPGASGTVRALVLSGTEVIVGGQFTGLGGGTGTTVRNRIGAIPLTSNTPTAWNPGASGTVFALVLSGTEVIVGGQFTTLGGAARLFIGAVPLDSNLATAWNPGASGASGNTIVECIAISGTEVIVGGDFFFWTGAREQAPLFPGSSIARFVNPAISP